ncbi:MAG TPA: helix-turn-helix transcriptional regulator [Candidatus Acidoferrales bacterium]|jgi:transcriptional regulator with XRE-family HTH domain|nr:helix-turn-helix transcriptional regulator [Candidatus Acidoferrales bacterium]
MIIGERLRKLREQKNLSQGDVEKRTGLLRCYISRVEHGHTVPAVSTLEKFARALEVPIYQLFYEGDESPKASLPKKQKSDSELFGTLRKDARLLSKFRDFLVRTDERSQSILLLTAKKMAKRKTMQALKR